MPDSGIRYGFRIMANTPKDHDGVIWITVPLDSRTAARLENLSDVCHAAPIDVAASLLHDILKDDEAAHVPSERPDGTALH